MAVVGEVVCVRMCVVLDHGAQIANTSVEAMYI